MSKRPGANKENLEETRKIFLTIARAEFCEQGYANASTSRIVEKSGMARGSLYYHFGDKQGLFQAVFEELMEEALETVNTTMNKANNPWDMLMIGTQSYLDLCMKKDFRKITLIESQAAMAYKDRLVIHERGLIGRLRTLVMELMQTGHFPAHTEKTIAVFIFGTLGEIGRSFDFSEDLKGDREIYRKALADSLERIKH